jgi:hypothetical protein
MTDYKKHFTLPLQSEEGYNSIVFDKDYNRAFDIINCENKDCLKIMNSINGEDYSINDKLTHKGGSVYLNGKEFIRVRSWGRLTGIGGLNLHPDKAAEIQDSFCDFIIKQLTK